VITSFLGGPIFVFYALLRITFGIASYGRPFRGRLEASSCSPGRRRYFVIYPRKRTCIRPYRRRPKKTYSAYYSRGLFFGTRYRCCTDFATRNMYDALSRLFDTIIRIFRTFPRCFVRNRLPMYASERFTDRRTYTCAVHYQEGAKESSDFSPKLVTFDVTMFTVR